MLRTYRIIQSQAVWERTSYLVVADNEEEAREKFSNAEIFGIEWSEITANVEFIDSEIESVGEVAC